MSEPEWAWPMNRSELIARVEALEAALAAAKNLLICTLDGVSPMLHEQIAAFTKETKAQPSTEGHFVPGPWAPQSDCFCKACIEYFQADRGEKR